MILVNITRVVFETHLREVRANQERKKWFQVKNSAFSVTNDRARVKIWVSNGMRPGPPQKRVESLPAEWRTNYQWVTRRLAISSTHPYALTAFLAEGNTLYDFGGGRPPQKDVARCFKLVIVKELHPSSPSPSRLEPVSLPLLLLRFPPVFYFSIFFFFFLYLPITGPCFRVPAPPFTSWTTTVVTIPQTWLMAAHMAFIVSKVMRER
jgi:hypothetical protein